MGLRSNHLAEKAATAVVLFVLISSTSIVLAREYHVSKAGEDNNSGTLQEPLETISAAARLARPGDQITVHEGIYREWIKPPRGGESDAGRIVYEAVPGEAVEIRGSEIIKGWERVSDGVWKVTLSNDFFNDYNPYRELIQGDWFDPMGREHHTGEVYLNGIPLWEASRMEEVFEPADEHSYWYSRIDESRTSIWADFGEVDPNAALVEINVRPACFYPEKPGVNFITMRGFKLCHAATQWAPPTAEQIGLIGTHWSKGWIIEDNEISDSRCTGITLGKYYDPEDKREASADQYNQTIRAALRRGWSKKTVGSHVVRNNRIYRCEQAGICGSMGAIFSLISGNHIHDIWVKRQFKGAEIGGIKFHGAIDTVIVDNYIHRAGRGIWLDWMTQGTRVTRNLLYDNTTDDLFLEVNHGPFLIDNNLLLSETAIRSWSEGGAFVHNLVVGDVILRPVLERFTPFHKPHATEVAGLSVTRGGDDRWFNNLFVGRSGLSSYDGVEFPVWMDGNVFLNGARPSKYESDPFVGAEIQVALIEESDGIYLSLDQLEGLERVRPSGLVTSELLGKARIAQQEYTDANGEPLRMSTDYFGRRRDRERVWAGPFASLAPGLKVWEK